MDHGSDVLAKDELGQTPLHWAVQGGEHEACALLLQWERGAQALCLSDKLGQTPTDIARLFDRKYLHIRNHRSLLRVLAKEYTNIKIPKLGFAARTEKLAEFMRNNSPKSDLNNLGLTKEIMRPKKNITTRVFRDLDGHWKV